MTHIEQIVGWITGGGLVVVIAGISAIIKQFLNHKKLMTRIEELERENKQLKEELLLQRENIKSYKCDIDTVMSMLE